MWGYPHIPVGRRVERPTQCRRRGRGSQLLGLRRDHSYLSAFVACPVREEPVIVALSARGADSDLLDAGFGGMLGDQRAKVDVARTRHGLAGQLLADVRADLVASAANGRAQMDGELVRGEAVSRQSGDGLGGNVGGGPSPARVEKCDNAGWVRDEDGYAVGDSDGEADSLLRGDVTVGFTASQEAFPATGVDDHPGPVDLPDGRQSAGGLGDVALDRRPSSHHFVDGLGAGKAEGPRVPGGGEGADPPTFEVWYDFFRDFGDATAGDRQRE